MHTTTSPTTGTTASYAELIQATRQFIASHPGITPELFDSVAKKDEQARDLGVDPTTIPDEMFFPAFSNDIVAKAVERGALKSQASVRRRYRI